MKKHLATYAAFLVGLVFIASGVSKLVDFDDFQLFIYSFNVLNLNLSMLLARVVIGFELSLGLLFVTQQLVRAASIWALSALGVFTVFLLYAIFGNASEDCHCFGNVVKLSNELSILKNVLLAGLIAWILKHHKQKSWRYKTLVFWVVLILSFSASLVVRPFDFMYLKTQDASEYFHAPALSQFVQKHRLEQQKVMLCFLSTDCGYCKTEAKKLALMSKNVEHPERIRYVFWAPKTSVPDFCAKTGLQLQSYLTMDVMSFLQLTKGKMPLIVLCDKGKVLKAYRFSDFDEQDFKTFLAD